MYSKVIIPLDESQLSEQALFYGRLIAGSLSVPIELAEAYDILPPAVHDKHTPQVVSHMLTEAQRRSERYLLEVQGRLEEAGFEALISTLQGMPADAIAALASADPGALVVMSTHGRGGIVRWALGSVADKVLHTIANPMLLVHAAAPGVLQAAAVPKVVLAPLDGSARAEMSLPHVAAMAEALAAEVLLLRVTPTVDYYHHHLNDGRTRADSPHHSELLSAEELVEADAGEVREYLQHVKDRLSTGFSRQISVKHQLSDNVAQVIIDNAAEQPSLVVMTTHGRSGIGRMVLGSVTDRVVRHSNLPVLVVR